MKSLKNMWQVMPLLAVGILAGSPSQAAVVTLDAMDSGQVIQWGGFSWTTEFNPASLTGGTGAPLNTGTIAYDDANSDAPLTITGSGAAGSVNQAVAVGISTEATAAGTVFFNWDFVSIEPAFFDILYWVNDGVDTTLTNVFLGSQSGTADGSVVDAFAVNANDLFGLSLISQTNNETFATATISDFAFTPFGGTGGGGVPVPVPPTFLLFGTAVLGLGFFRKMKQAA